MTTKPTNETEIFQAAANLPAEERGPFLDRACGDNQPLRREIESLLKAHDPDGSFLQSPALAATVDRPEVNQTIDEQPGSMIGPYKIREKIGEGGFGVVYVAEQEQPVRRKVALKVIKPGMDSREIVARFEAERQALALMDHPHIAKILDASTTASGRPYFVMELVRGVLITDYCNAQKLPTKQRLELFIQVCHAVQHAHQKGVVHRDLKPSNVLVAPHDGVPVVKVIDFGVAKALGQQLTDKSIYTRFASMIGTPLYMSPEQAEINALDVDTRSDVYSLGVLLYELLTGTTPFDRKKLESAAFDEMRRIIREEMPESPSARVTTFSNESKAIAASHGVDSESLAKIIRGDLDVIVMKALEKERGRRYDTASAFAEDIGRFLNQEPILARPASAAYRLKKFVYRNWAAVTAGSSVAAALLLGTAVSTWLAIRESRASREADQERQIAELERGKAVTSSDEAIAARHKAEAAEQRLRLQLYVSDCSHAFRAADEGNMELVNELLERHRPSPEQEDLRGSEWYYLRRLCDDSRNLPTFNHGTPVSALAISPNGERQATVSDDGTVVIWDIATRKKAMTFGVAVNASAEPISTIRARSAVEFSSDSKLVAAFVGGRLWKWDLTGNGKEIASIAITNQRVLAAAFSPDLASLAVVLDGRSGIHFHEVSTGKNLMELATPKDSLAQRAVLAFSPDGEFLASSRGFQTWVWDLAQRKPSFTRSKDDHWTTGLALSRGGKVLAMAFGGPPHLVEVLDVGANREIARFQEPTEHIRRLAISPDGKYLAGGGDEAKLYFWDVSTARQAAVFKGHGGAITSVTIADNGGWIASAAMDGLARRWELDGEQKDRFKGDASFYPISLSCSPDGMALSLEAAPKNRTGKKRDVRVWDATTGRELPESNALGFQSNKTSPLRSHESRFEVRLVGSIVELRDTESGKLVSVLKGHRTSIRDWHFAPDGRTLATGAGTQIKLWNLATFEEIGTLQIDSIVYKLAYLPDGTLVSADNYCEVRLWRTSARSLPLVARPKTITVENSQTAAAIQNLEEAIRLQEDSPGQSGNKNADSPLVADMKTGERLIALANQRDKLIDAYLATNRLNDAQARVLGWIELMDKPDARSLLAALRVVRGHIKSEQHDLAKSLLVQLEAATKRGVSSDSDAVLTKLAMPNDVKQLSLLCEIGSQYLALREYVSAERLYRECIDEYTSIEQKGRFVLPTLKKQAQYILGCALLEQSKYSEAEPLLLASLLSEEELSDGADSTDHKAAIAALEKLYIATDRPELAQKWRAKP